MFRSLFVFLELVPWQPSCCVVGFPWVTTFDLLLSSSEFFRYIVLQRHY